MAKYPVNHYVLILQNNYTKKQRIFDVYNTSDDPLFYKFEQFEMPDDFKDCELNSTLFWCVLDYSIKLSNNVLDSEITVTTNEGETKTLYIKDLTPDTGIIGFPNMKVPEKAIDEPQPYYSL